MKLYITEIANEQNIVVFDDIRNDWNEDDNGFYTEDQATFDWWNTLADAIEFLENNGIEAEINELADYIQVAKENGFKG